MSLEKYGETIIMKDHLCWVQMFGAYPSGNDQLLKDFIGNRMYCFSFLEIKKIKESITYSHIITFSIITPKHHIHKYTHAWQLEKRNNVNILNLSLI